MRREPVKISTKGRYAVRLLYDLAQHNTGEWISLKDVSKRQGISIKYLEQIVRQLSICGYLKSLRGPRGGYQLSKNLRNIRSEMYWRLQKAALPRLRVWTMRPISANVIMIVRQFLYGKDWIKL